MVATRSIQALHDKVVTKRASKVAAKKLRSPVERKIQGTTMEMIVQTIIKQKNESKDDRLPRGYISTIVNTYKHLIPSLDSRMIKNAYTYKMKCNKKDIQLLPSDSLSSTDAILPTDLIIDCNNQDNTSSLGNMTGDSPTGSSQDSTPSQDSTLSTITLSRSRPGRPVGTTIKNKIEQTMQYRTFVNEVSLRFHQQKKEANSKGNRDAVYKRIQRNTIVINPSIAHPGLKSPLAASEPAFVEILLHLARIKHSIGPSDAKLLINSMIADTPIQDELKKHQIKYCGLTPDSASLGKVSNSYWTGFKKRWAHKLVTKKGRRFELDRSNWTKYSNFAAMYDNIASEMVAAGVAKELPTPVWMNEKGEVVSDKKMLLE